MRKKHQPRIVAQGGCQRVRHTKGTLRTLLDKLAWVPYTHFHAMSIFSLLLSHSELLLSRAKRVYLAVVHMASSIRNSATVTRIPRNIATAVHRRRDRPIQSLYLVLPARRIHPLPRVTSSIAMQTCPAICIMTNHRPDLSANQLRFLVVILEFLYRQVLRVQQNTGQRRPRILAASSVEALESWCKLMTSRAITMATTVCRVWQVIQT